MPVVKSRRFSLREPDWQNLWWVELSERNAEPGSQEFLAMQQAEVRSGIGTEPGSCDVHAMREKEPVIRVDSVS